MTSANPVSNPNHAAEGSLIDREMDEDPFPFSIVVIVRSSACSELRLFGAPPVRSSEPKTHFSPAIYIAHVGPAISGKNQLVRSRPVTRGFTLGGCCAGSFCKRRDDD